MKRTNSTQLSKLTDEEEKLKERRRLAVEKVLKTPVFVALTDQAEKVRRNLLVLSLISIFSVLWDIQLDSTASIFGFTFEGLTPEKVLLGLTLITGFSLANFLWLSADSFVEWRLRITGTRLTLVTTGRFSSADGDYPDDPRQSTLYYWWSQEAEKVGDLSSLVKGLVPELEQIKTTLAAIQTDQLPYLNGIQGAVSGLTNSVGVLTNKMDDLVKTAESHRPDVSLARFDSWFSLFNRSQNLRWLLLEVGAPTVLAAYALILLGTAIYVG